MVFRLEEAQERLEELMAMAFNGEMILVDNGQSVVKPEPIAERTVPGKKYTAEDFYE